MKVIAQNIRNNQSSFSAGLLRFNLVFDVLVRLSAFLHFDFYNANTWSLSDSYGLVEFSSISQQTNFTYALVATECKTPKAAIIHRLSAVSTGDASYVGLSLSTDIVISSACSLTHTHTLSLNSQVESLSFSKFDITQKAASRVHFW